MRFLVPLLLVLLSGPALAQMSLTTEAERAFLVDLTTGTVLFEKAADEKLPTASMSKVMTMFMVFEALDQGVLSLDDQFTVSERAWRIGGAASGGSTSFLEVGSQVAVEDLIRGVIIQSGNDAAIVLAEGLAGTEQAFAQQMSARARALGMTNSNFMNATGLPDPRHYSTARDLALLAARLITEFPQYYDYYSETEFTYNGIRQGNRNPLLYRNIGADGVKTGYTDEAGYCLIGSVNRDGRRLVSVVTGLDSAQARADESAKLLQYGLRAFDTFQLIGAGDVIGEAPVWLGVEDSVPLQVTEGLVMTLPRASPPPISAMLEMDQPLDSPVTVGQAVGVLNVRVGSGPIRQLPVITGAGTARLETGARMGIALQQILFGTGAP